MWVQHLPNSWQLLVFVFILFPHFACSSGIYWKMSKETNRLRCIILETEIYYFCETVITHSCAPLPGHIIFTEVQSVYGNRYHNAPFAIQLAYVHVTALVILLHNLAASNSVHTLLVFWILTWMKNPRFFCIGGQQQRLDLFHHDDKAVNYFLV